MILPHLPAPALTELGRTGGGPGTLALLVRDQDTRRLLMLRALLEAAAAAPESTCPTAARERLAQDWALLEAAEAAETAQAAGTAQKAETLCTRATATGGRPRAAGADERPEATGDSGWPEATGDAGRPEATGGGQRPEATGGGPADVAGDGGPRVREHRLPAARAALLHPLLGPWVQRCLRGLGSAHTPADAAERERHRRELGADLAHFSAVAAAVAARAGVPYEVRLTPHAGRLVLPSLGALHTDAPHLDVVHRAGRLTFRTPGAADVVVRVQDAVGAWSASRQWTSAYALPGLSADAPLPLDDLDPYRTVHGGPHYYGLSGPVTLDDGERKRWLQAWSGTADALRLGGEQRLAETRALLRCLVPLAVPPGAAAGGRSTGGCSATRKEAFGAVLSSTPPSATGFAATLVHELHHAKLTVLAEMVTLHHSDGRARYFAPWRPDPRPYDGLLQGAYSHLALADYFQRRALTGTDPVHREDAWAQYARYHEQVGAALPALVGSDRLTSQGRQFVDALVGHHQRLAEQPAPRAHAFRAREYVRAARRLWAQRHGLDVRHPRD
ncbi:HEXXH motif-containing putative peptide modification protein [Streptomyces longwoodensis]|uniref:aKG-HExxH-type peptide beta-hydroxylase n=1 Tax=Streptomyces longwoodensis TaxID=68231 RepID=UPI0033FA5727